MRLLSRILLLVIVANATFMATYVHASEEPVPFVMQLTRKSEDFGHRRAFLQIDKVLTDIGEKKLEIVVVAYEDGIHALLENNPETSQLLTKLANRGVTFKACRISMQAWGLEDNQFPLEVGFVPAGAPEVIRLQMQGYKYWRP
ncbi:MAG: DsrE family protein [Granulosicoccaceae bacterium]|jgi:intracellular sulfur oxidation DsrE/DsrF family protein